eukprot:TRINITY_DN6820_c0_g1_i1.p1 TRINITY_DN6820_c0_g1~~TRINITY_DN6820_c0_g1_i1.p1  ORF type:complete len:174 (+),score=32.20 TRINITY_DN6820_c0_g1_i1:292-813(+)
MGWKPKDSDGRLGDLFRGAGLEPFWGSYEADTMDSHRLAYYASEVSPEKGEAVWSAMSERYFEGKRTEIHPIRLDNHELLLECAAEAGLDPVEAARVVSSNAYRDEVFQSFNDMQRAGINSIPVLIFEVSDPEIEPSAGLSLDPARSAVHHGSGSTAEFVRIFKDLHTSCAAL